MTIGWFGEDVWEGAADVVSSVADNLTDAGKLVGAALQAVAPIVAMWPGIGTAVSVAFSAAAAVAQGTPVDEALIRTASSAIPGGLPRIGFDTSVAVTRDVVAGRNAFGSVVDGLRAAAQQAGGDRARFAFDTGLGIARGQKVSEQAIRAARDQVAQGGTQALAAFDAGVAVAKGEGASGALLAAARDYVASTGNPIALAAFDSGLALAHGQALQDAGFAALKGLVAGNDSGERAVRYLEKIEKAARTGQSVVAVLTGDLRDELGPLVGQVDVGKALQPYIDAIKLDPSALTWGSRALAEAWGEAEPFVRAAQAIMHTGVDPDEELRRLLTSVAVKSIGRVDTSTDEAERARWAAIVAANPGVPEICLRASDARARSSPVAANLEAQCSALGGRPLIRSSVSVPATIYSLASLSAAAAPAPVAPKSVAVPFKPIGTLPIVKAAARSAAPASSASSDLLIGGAVGLGVLAVVWLAVR